MKTLTLEMICPTIDFNIKPGVHFDIKYLLSFKLDFDVVLSNGKKLQRDLVWSQTQKESLIISMLKRIQISNFCGVVIYDKDTTSDKLLRIVDGKQRLTTIISFFSNEFPITVNGEQYFYNDLDQRAKNQFRNTSLVFDLVYDFNDGVEPPLTDEQLIRWFEFVNFNGTPQDIEHLNFLKS